MGGGGGDTHSTVTQEFKPPQYVRSGGNPLDTRNFGNWENYVSVIPGIMDWFNGNQDRFVSNAANPFDAQGNFIGNQDQKAGLGRVANLNPLQKSAMDAIGGGLNSQLYGYNQPGTGLDSYLTGILNGNTGDQRSFENAYSGATNPAFEDAIRRQRQSATDSFSRSTAAQSDAAAARAGAFGGSAHNELTANNAKALEDSLGAQEASMRSGQMDRAANDERQRQQMLSNSFENSMGRQIQTVGMLPQISQMQTNRALAALGAGDVRRGYEQQVIDGGQGYLQQLMSYGLLPWDVMGNMLSRASGTGGSNMSTTSQSAMSPLQGLLGGGMLAGGLYNAFK